MMELARCFNCHGYREVGTHYFCYRCCRHLFMIYNATTEDMEAYMNLSYEGEWVFTFTSGINIFDCYAFIRLLVANIKPLPNIIEYILLFKLVNCRVYYQNMYHTYSTHVTRQMHVLLGHERWAREMWVRERGRGGRKKRKGRR